MEALIADIDADMKLSHGPAAVVVTSGRIYEDESAVVSAAFGSYDKRLEIFLRRLLKMKAYLCIKAVLHPKIGFSESIIFIGLLTIFPYYGGVNRKGPFLLREWLL